MRIALVGTPMKFDATYSFFEFSEDIWFRERYFRTPQTNAFLQAVAATSDIRTAYYPAGHRFFRAQLGHGEGVNSNNEWPVPHSPERMKPRRMRAIEGRANAKGIPALYSATTLETALMEVRPWVGMKVTVADAFLNRDLNLIDCSRGDHDGSASYTDPTLAEDRRADIVWHQIDKAFGAPVQRGDDLADYANTQVLAEFFKVHAYDGIIYHSVFGEDGRNVALFDPADVAIGTCVIHEIKSLSCSHEKIVPRQVLDEFANKHRRGGFS